MPKQIKGKDKQEQGKSIAEKINDKTYNDRQSNKHI